MTAFNNLKILTKIAIPFLLLVVLSVVSCVTNISGLTRQNDAVDMTEHTYQVLATLDAIVASMVDQETGLRGFLVAGDDKFLEPLKAGQVAYRQNFDKVKLLTSDNPVQQSRLDQLDASVAGWTKVMEKEQALMREPGKTEEARGMEAAGAGKQFMDAIRAKAKEMGDEERGLLGKRKADADDAANSTAFSNYVSSGLTILLSGLALWVIFLAVVKPVKTINDAMRSLAAGNRDTEVPHSERKDEVGEMAQAVAIFRSNAIAQFRLEQDAESNRSLTEKERAAREEQKAREAAAIKFAVDSLAGGLSHLSDGNVAFRLQQPFAADLDAVRVNFNNSAEKLQSALNRVSINARGIDAGTNEIKAAADSLAKRTEQQASAIEETAAALEEITTTVKDATKRAQEAGQLVSRAKAGAEQSGEVVRKAVIAMERIEKSSSEIGNIIGVIDEIAFQTNLLALNAGVEAARAGEAGKGFAVVAQEVRELAQRSANAAKEIKALITTSNGQVQEGVQLVGDTGKALETIVVEVQEINRHVLAIVESAQEQSSGLQQINSAVNQMDQDTQRNAAMVEETTASTHSLAQEVSSLNQLLSQFKLGDQNTSMPAARPASRSDAPVASPVRALGRKIASAFAGSRGSSDTQWEDF